MGFFKKLFGGKSKPESRPLEQEKAPQKPKGAEGELPQRNFASESSETPRTVSCMQYRFGKILQSPGGPIVQGVDHHATGYSVNLPKGIPGHPNEFFKRGLGRQKQYPWEEGGPIVKKLFEIDDKQYVVCAREMWPSEAGEGKPGRPYTEMHEIVIPADEWSVAVIPQLSDVLEAKGVTERDTSMPTIELKTDVLDQPLPNDWFDDYTKDLISNVVSGKPIALQEWDVSQADFLKRLFFASICLPENLARQMSFGTGLDDMNEGQVRVAHTMQAKSQLRKIGGTWRGEVKEEDVAFGHRYLTALITVMGNCQTPREVMAAVKNMPQDMTAEVEGRFS